MSQQQSLATLIRDEKKRPLLCIVSSIVALTIILVIVFFYYYIKDEPKSNEDSANTGTGTGFAPTAPGESHQAVLAIYQKKYSGDGTYYGNTKEGTCSYGQNLPAGATDSKIWALAALNAPQFMGSLVCGLCVKVSGSGKGLGSSPITGDHIVFVKDLCPECLTGSVDVALDGDGRWKIDIQAVQCPVGDSKIQYSFHGSNQWYVKLQIRNARIPITNIQLQRKGIWVTPTHTKDGHWIVADSTEWQTGTIDIRMTAANGQQLEDTIPKLENDSVQNGLKGVQVPLDSSLPNA